MSLSPDDPRLTSYLLGELPAEEAAAIEKAVAADPALRASLQELESLKTLLGDTLAPRPASLAPAQREAIRRSAILAGQTSRITPLPAPHRRFPFKSLLIPFAAAAAILLGLFLIPSGKSPSGTTAGTSPPPSPEPTILPVPGPIDISRASPPATPPRPLSPDLPDLALRGSVMASESPGISLPVRSGNSSLNWIRESILDQSELPPPNAVRLEEILNSFPLRPGGAAAIAQGVTLSTETLPCPWRPSATLLFVSVRGAASADHQVRASFQTDPSAVFRYRLLGYASVTGGTDGEMESLVPAGSLTTVALEIEPLGSATRYGSIQWSVDGKSAAEVPVTFDPAAEPSDDARFATLVCTYAQWLAGDQRGVIDEDIVAALAREVAADNLPPERFQFLELIDRTLNL